MHARAILFCAEVSAPRLSCIPAPKAAKGATTPGFFSRARNWDVKVGKHRGWVTAACLPLRAPPGQSCPAGRQTAQSPPVLQPREQQPGPRERGFGKVSSAHLSVPDVGGQHLVFLILWEEEGTGLAQGDPPAWWWSGGSRGLTTLRMAYTITSMATVVVVRQSRTGRVLFL